MTGSELYPWVQLRYVAKTGTGHTPSRTRPELWIEAERSIPWVTLADVHQLRSGDLDVIHETAELISPAGVAASSAVVHPAGTVLLSRTASVGFSALMGTDMAVSQDFMTWTPGPKLSGRFLRHVLRGRRSELLGLMHGSTHKTIYMPDLLAIKVPLPPIDIQRRIANFLDCACERIAALEARLVAIERPALEAEQGAIDRLGAGTKRWRLSWVAQIQTGLTLGKRYESASLTSFPYLRVANVQADHIATDDVAEVSVPPAVAAGSTLQRGDLLMTEGGDIDKLGRGAVWDGSIDPCLHQNHVFAVRCEPSYDPQFLAFWTASAEARSYFERTASRITNIASTNLTKVRALKVPAVTLDAQRLALRELSEVTAPLEQLRARAHSVRAALAEYRDALIIEAVTGRLDVSRVSDAILDESARAAIEGERPEVLSG